MHKILRKIINTAYNVFFIVRLILALIGVVAIVDVSTTVYSSDIVNKIESYETEYFTLGEVFDFIDFDYAVMTKRYGAESSPLYVTSVETGLKYNISYLGTRNAIFVFFKNGEPIDLFEMNEVDLFVEGNGSIYDIVIYKDELLHKFYVNELSEVDINAVISVDDIRVIGKVENINTEDKDYFKEQVYG